MKPSITHIIISTPFGETYINCDMGNHRISYSKSRTVEAYIAWLLEAKGDIEELIHAPLVLVEMP